MDTITFKATGIRPLLMHNGQLADPLNAHAKKMKEITSKRGKTEADYAALSKLEWTGSLYVDEEGRVVLPSHVIEATIKSGGKKFKRGKDFDQGVFVDQDSVLEFPDQHRPITELRDDERYRLYNLVKVGQSKVARTRPKFDEWAAEFTVNYDPEVINRSDMIQYVEAAGAQVGFAEWRPKYGRFSVKVVE